MTRRDNRIKFEFEMERELGPKACESREGAKERIRFFFLCSSRLRGLLSGLVVLLLCATQPGRRRGELLQRRRRCRGMGSEVYRIVSGPDEIVSVLRNGAVVICKRVASPVAAVRGYAETGGVYEGQWLGGG